MQNFKWYVLGKPKSPLLEEYFEKYFRKIDGLFAKFLPELQKKVIKMKDYREFILNSEISALLNNFDKMQNKNSLQKFVEELKIFVKEGIESPNLSQNKWEKIPWTSVKLTLEDINPYNSFEAHPDRSGGSFLWFWEKSEEDWLQVYGKTFELLKKVDENFYEEVTGVIKKIIPLGTAKETHNSASYKECIWHLYLGYEITSSQPEVLNMDAIIHEYSHNKLNLILHFDPVILNPYEEKYYSAIRPDARPISGVFLGYHAFAPVMYVIMKAYNDGLIEKTQNLLEKIILFYFKTKFLQKVIKKYAVLTEIWKEVSEEIDYVITLMDKIFIEINPSKELIEKAKQRQKEHFEEVNNNYKNLVY